MPVEKTVKVRKRVPIRTFKIVKCEGIRRSNVQVFDSHAKALAFIESFAHTIPRRVKRIGD